MPRQIMVPLDGSRFSEQAVAYAMGVAARAQARIHLTRVHADGFDIGVTPLPTPLAVTADTALQWALRDAEQSYLNRIAAPWLEAGIDVCIANPNGPAAAALAAYAEAANIDLVVMTSHGRGGLSRAWLGSVADRLVRTTNVPVLLLRPLAAVAHPDPASFAPEGPPFHAAHILIPLDGSDLSETIIEPAVELGRLVGARYTLVQVVLPPIDATAEVIAHGELETEELRDAALGYLNAWRDRLRARGLTVEASVVVQANPAAGIVEEAMYAECDMIAMATHGRSGWTRATLGSVADKVLRSSPAPLLTLRPEIAVGAGQ